MYSIFFRVLNANVLLSTYWIPPSINLCCNFADDLHRRNEQDDDFDREGKQNKNLLDLRMKIIKVANRGKLFLFLDFTLLFFSAKNFKMNAVLGQIASTTQELAHFIHFGKLFHIARKRSCKSINKAWVSTCWQN
ncbi:uncharacterized protein LOC111888799 [Lactuca sativa]|uniref:uncharacterized protein LOC111888799 n=1 Tax=Lactuca sativa TaxID=4236 RepID=UPI000CCAC011|nr:uncharacterized protein LOC111888799 [Lactuca sativa]